MLLRCLSIHDNIIQVIFDTCYALQDGSHHLLESGGCQRQAIGNPALSEQAVMSDKSCNISTLLMQGKLIVCISQINSRKYCSTPKAGKHLVNVW